MKCRICGCEAPEGAKLCKDCAAARKRAFAATVTRPFVLAAAGAPSVSHPRFSLRPAKPPKRPTSKPQARQQPPARQQPLALDANAALKAGSSARGPVSPAISPVTPAPAPVRQSVTPVGQPEPLRFSLRLSWRWARIAAGIAFVVVLFAIMVVLRRSHPAVEDAGAPPARPEPPAHAAAVSPPPEATAGVPLPPAEVEPAPPAAKPALTKTRRKTAPAEDAIKTPAPEPKPAIAADPTPRNVVAPQQVIDTVRPDPLRALNDALARCTREDLLNRPACEQKARSQSCSNYWGQVPQCPIGPGTDHGQ